MAEAKVSAWRNKSKSCKVGRDPAYSTYAHESVFDDARITPIAPGGGALFVGPGDTVLDEHGTMKLVVAKGDEFFVECHDEDEAKDLRVPRERWLKGNADSNWPDKLVGFYGVQHVLEDITAEYVGAVSAGTRIASIKRTKELEESAAKSSATVKQQSDEITALKAQIEHLQRQSFESRGNRGK